MSTVVVVLVLLAVALLAAAVVVVVRRDGYGTLEPPRPYEDWDLDGLSSLPRRHHLV